MRKKIFKACLQLSIGLMAVLSIAAVLIHQFLKTQEDLSRLENFGSVIADAIDLHGIDFLKDNTYSWMRISVISQDGTILYDSAFDENTLDNHRTRAEVDDAIHKGKSTISRYSNTLKKQTYYHAIHLKNGYVLRLSFSSDSVYLYTLNFMAFLAILLCILIVFCYYIATLLSRSIIEPIDKINLNTIKPNSNSIDNVYNELRPFIRRITSQQLKIDEQYQELRLRANEFQAITKSMSDGLIMLNADGNIISINKIARKIFAVTKEDCLNQNYLAIDNFEYLKDMMAQVSEKPKQTRNIVRDGRDYELRFSRIEDSGICIGYAIIILDITDKKRTEKQRQEFTANVSHELKTPLQSIIGYSEMMANGFVKAGDIKHFASRINKQSSRLKTLIEDIIFLSQLDEGQVAIMEPISISQTCREVFDNLQEKAQEHGITLSVVGSDIKFIGVSRYIYELIYNLTDNAIRYNSENGSVTVSMQTTNNKYLITVADTGIGIAPDEQYRIFERFYRVDKSHSRQTGGTGLGLSIVKRVVLYHQGKIRINSEVGKGTTFTITFYKDKLAELKESNERRQLELLQESEKEMAISDAITAEQAIENYRLKKQELENLSKEAMISMAAEELAAKNKATAAQSSESNGKTSAIVADGDELNAVFETSDTTLSVNDALDAAKKNHAPNSLVDIQSKDALLKISDALSEPRDISSLSNNEVTSKASDELVDSDLQANLSSTTSSYEIDASKIGESTTTSKSGHKAADKKVSTRATKSASASSAAVKKPRTRKTTTSTKSRTRTSKAKDSSEEQSKST